ncbi:S9 family peptidase [Rhodohalobacter mucosus]|uniref:S9 family peptidase n=1 Tax=Rhodohalobacter mucosus TaxID=2079485 RepID=A0A316TU11_9BACT|nr:prolyl oligopeptidase family serine peptidase [Rhodohalobacter mucosus]PWN08053.1 S9 family peptidase [Rhodohalobacter mucosus]
MRNSFSVQTLFIVLLLFCNPLFAQDKALTVDDYDRWSRIVGAELSNDGNWMAYGLRPNGGDDTLHVVSLANDTEYIIPLGENAVFSDNSGWVAYTVTVDEETRESLEEKGDPVFESAQILHLRSGEKYTVERLESMTFTEDGRYWAVHRKKPETDKSKHKGTDLIVRDLQSGTVVNLGNVSEFAFNKKSSHLAYLVDASERAGNGIYLRNMESGALLTLDSDSSVYSGLTWDDDDALRNEWPSKGNALAVLKGHSSDSLMHIVNELVVLQNLDSSVRKTVLNPDSQRNFPDGMVISENRDLQWSSNGELLFIGIRPQQPKVEMDRDTIPNVDVFHWKDDRIQTVQERQAARDRRFTYVASFSPANSSFTRLTDEGMREMNFSRHNRYMIGRDEKPYISDLNWGVSPADLYRVDVSSGERTRFAVEIKRTMGFSPDGRYYLFQKVAEQDTILYVYDVERNRNVNLTQSSPVSFINVDHPYPHESPTYGVAGWAQDGDHVIMNHKHDLWRLALDGSGAENITRGVGERDQIIFRHVSLDDDERYIDTSEDLLLSAFGRWTKKNGFYRLRMGNNPRSLVYEDVRFGNPEKARDENRIVLTRETFVEFPDYYHTKTSFRNFTKITDANPQQAEYGWGERVLIDFENSRGERLQGTLTLPAGYEPGETYPMIVYFYERMSDRHHQYSMPVYDDRPHMSTYASNGYLVFMPDIVFEFGRPGTSSLDAITAGTQKVIDLGYADPDQLGLQGHSWGGYQSSFILTQTDLFATVVTGAPPTNLTSFYNNIYGSSGTNHHGIMEIGQVRMGRGVTPWTHREMYQRENPMFFVPDIEIPFMILHGTDDGAVDWMQGLEFYNAARRMGKEVVLLSYPGEGHHLGREANQIDFQIRMKEWFDHYVKGAPAADWIVNGIPYIEKQYNRAE